MRVQRLSGFSGGPTRTQARILAVHGSLHRTPCGGEYGAVAALPRAAGEAVHLPAPTPELAPGLQRATGEPKVKARQERRKEQKALLINMQTCLHTGTCCGAVSGLQTPHCRGYSQEMALCRPLPQQPSHRPPPHLCQLCWGPGEAEAGLGLPTPGAHEWSPPLWGAGTGPRAESGGRGKGGRQQLLQTLSRKPE